MAQKMTPEEKAAKAEVKKLTAALTPAELSEISMSAQSVWQSIAFDVIDETTSIPRAEVLELVLDADRFFSELMRHKVYQASPTLQALFKDRYSNRASMAWLTQYLKQHVFTYTRYGL